MQIMRHALRTARNRRRFRVLGEWQTQRSLLQVTTAATTLHYPTQKPLLPLLWRSLRQPLLLLTLQTTAVLGTNSRGSLHSRAPAYKMRVRRHGARSSRNSSTGLRSSSRRCARPGTSNCLISTSRWRLHTPACSRKRWHL